MPRAQLQQVQQEATSPLPQNLANLEQAFAAGTCRRAAVLQSLLGYSNSLAIHLESARVQQQSGVNGLWLNGFAAATCQQWDWRNSGGESQLYAGNPAGVSEQRCNSRAVQSESAPGHINSVACYILTVQEKLRFPSGVHNTLQAEREVFFKKRSGCGKMSRTPSLGRDQVSSDVSTPLPVQQDHES